MAAANSPGLAEQIGEAGKAMMVAIMPGVMGAVWMAMIIIDGTLAQGLLMRFGRQARPPAAITAVTLPRWALLVPLAVAVVAIRVPGNPGYVAQNALVILGVPFFVAGLSVIHAFAQTRRNKLLPLLSSYLVMIVLFWPTLLVIGLGVVEHWAGLKARIARSRPDREV
jgi:uncharacterized protein YybS (DUF2232 family)